MRRALLIGRLDRLADMGLAQKTTQGGWHFNTEAASTLRAMGERGDIIRTMQRAFAREQREYAIVNPTRMSTSIVGRVAFKGLRDELYDRGTSLWTASMAVHTMCLSLAQWTSRTCQWRAS